MHMVACFRDLQKRSISVYFRRKSPKRQVSNNRELTRLYAPPSYDVVIGMDENPPPYQSDDSSGSDVDDGAFTEQVTSCTCAKHGRMNSESMDNIRNKQKAKTNSQPTVRVTSAVVVCDIEGNSLPCCSKDDDEDPSHLKQTNYHLTASASASGLPEKGVNGHANGLPGKGINGHANGHVSAEVEVIYSDDDSSETREERIKKSESNGTVKRSKSNGHARVNYSRSLSRQAESARIEFINN